MATPKKITPRQAAAVRANLLAKKISDMEARKASSTMNKRPGSAPAFVSNQRPLLSKSERVAEGKQSKINADKEKAIQKQRRFAKGEGKLPIKERVGTKAEYKALGKEIQTRKQLIAYAKQARINQAERAKNPKAAPAKPTPVKETTPVAEKKATPAKTTAKKAAATPAKKTAAAPKASTAAIKKRTLPATPKAKAEKAPKARATKTPELQTLKQAQANAPKPKGAQAKKLQTLEEAKAKAPTPKMGPEAPAKTEAPKVEAKAVDKPKKTSKTAVGKTLSKAAQTTAGKKVVSKAKSAPKSALQKITSNKKVRLLGRASIGIPLAVEAASIIKGSTAKDFKTIQKLENKLAKAKGQKPKYTNMGSNLNVGSALKTDLSSLASNITMGAVGKTRQARIAELKKMINKTSGTKPAANKPGAKPKIVAPVLEKGGKGPASAPIGNKYIVKKGDTLSAIASRSGVSLSEIRAANPKFAAQAKYKNGNMIFSGTSVAIPKKKVK